MIVASFTGSVAPPSLIARIRSGEIGGVILFSSNVAGGATATRALTGELQRAAREGNNPPLLIMTDQEGGEVKRLVGPPTLAPQAMSSSVVAFQQGRKTGRLLRDEGINVDLAPVADVERVAGSFLGSRAFGTTASTVRNLACAFAEGVASQQVAFTLKHFPGLGRAASSTDLGPVAIDASPADLRSDYQPYQRCGANPLALVMVSSATYPALAGPLPAVMSSTTYSRELPVAIPSRPALTISDDMESPAITRETAPARTAINAGLDLLLYAGTEQGSADAYPTLLAEARSGLVKTGRIRAADQSIAALKRMVGS
jgi:beta-N-acetylhexosaminidase